jgi:2-desacetyl-2-hydroxyethyl bacteriochlorophyllide A dehydrogenase
MINGEKMKAAVLRAPLDIRIEEVDKPKIGSKEVLVRPLATAICGTDVQMYNGSLKVKLPLIMGHETAGDIVEVGKDVRGFKIGDRVVIYPIIFCGSCYLCNMGRIYLCPNGGLMGREVNGTYAEFVSVPEHLLYKLPEKVSYKEGAVVELLWTVVHGHTRIKVSPGDSVAVLGMGASGLLHVGLAKISGADPVIAISRSEWKLNLAKKFGADRIINTMEIDPVSEVLEITDGRGADIVIESVGSTETVLQSLEMVRPGGTILQFGVCTQPINNYNAHLIYFKEVNIIGTRAMCPSEFEPTIKLVTSGRIDLKPLITHEFPLEKIRNGLELINKRPSEVLRAIIV